MRFRLEAGICALISFAVCIGGCSRNNLNVANNANTKFDPYSDQYCFSKTLGLAPSMVSSESGYYFYTGPSSNYLYYTDKATMKTAPLCNKPDCLHANEKDKKKREYCNANIKGENVLSIGDPIFYGSKLYITRGVLDTNYTIKYLLTEFSLDGTQRKDVFTYKAVPQYVIIHRGFLYFTTTDYGDINEEESSSISKSRLYRVPVEDMSKNPEVIYENEGVSANIGGLKAYGNILLFNCINYKENILMSYHSVTGNVSIVNNHAKKSVICGNKLIVSIDNENKCICDLDGSNKKTLSGAIGTPYSDDTYLLTETAYMPDANGNPAKRILRAYDLAGKELQSFDLSKYNGATIFGSDSKYILLMTSRLAGEKEMVYEYWKIDKSAIAGGSAKMEKYYSYSFNPNPDMG